MAQQTNSPKISVANLCQQCPSQQKCLGAELTAEQQASLSTATYSNRRYPKGQLLYRQGDAVSNLHSLKTGAVKTYYLDADGNQQITGFYTAGDVCGLIDFSHSVRHEYAEVIADAVICQFSLRWLWRNTAANSTLLQSLLAQYGKQMLIMQANAKDQPAAERVMTFLRQLQQNYQRKGLSVAGFSLPMSHKDMANYLRLRPETLSRTLQHLKQNGCIRLKGKTVLSLHSQTAADLALAS